MGEEKRFSFDMLGYLGVDNFLWIDSLWFARCEWVQYLMGADTMDGILSLRSFGFLEDRSR